MRDLRKDLETCEAATPGPVRWQKFGFNYHLTGQYGLRPIILSTISKNFGVVISNRDPETDLLIPLDPNHADSKFIEEAWQGWPEAINRALKAEEEINYQTSELVAYKKENAELKDKLLNSGPWPQFAVEAKNKRLEEENAKLREALQEIHKHLYNFMHTGQTDKEKAERIDFAFDMHTLIDKALGKTE